MSNVFETEFYGKRKTIMCTRHVKKWKGFSFVIKGDFKESSGGWKEGKCDKFVRESITLMLNWRALES